MKKEKGLKMNHDKGFDWKLLVTMMSLFVNIGGWFAINSFSKSRDIENKKREIKIEYLIKAYRTMQENCGYRLKDFKQITEKELKQIENLEQAFVDIQLFGSISQVRKAREVCKNAKTENIRTENDPRLRLTWEANDLLLDIRRDLRKELLLEEINPEEDIKEGIRKLGWSKIIENLSAK